MQYENTVTNEDCLSFLPKLKEGSITMALYDPPYYTTTAEARTFDFKKNGKKTRKSYSTYLGDWDVWKSEEDFFGWLKKLLVETHRVLIPQGALYLFCRDGYVSDIRRLLRETGYVFKNVIVWVKSNPLQNIMHVSYNTACEFQVFAIKDDGRNVKTPAVFNWLDQQKIYFPKDKFSGGESFDINMHSFVETPICIAPERVVDEKKNVLHSTQKPVEILLRSILVSSNAGDVVLDATSGTGSTLEATKLLDRKYIGCEIDKRYYDYSVKRLNGTLCGYDLSRRVKYIVEQLKKIEKKEVKDITSFFGADCVDKEK